MIHPTYSQLTNREVQKICKSCGTEFTSISWYNKEYCSLTCSKREKRHRRRARDTGQAIKVESRYFDEIPNPTITQLDAYAVMVLKEQTDKPVRFYGTIPMWTPPAGIIFNKSEGIDYDEWLMWHPSMLED